MGDDKAGWVMNGPCGAFYDDLRRIAREACPRCGHVIRVGDWPTCKGNPEDHQQPHYSWHFDKGKD